jgi:diaminopimelate epimerase
VIAFEKWEGLGNDFIVVDSASFPAEAGSELVRKICDRRTGIGADGVLVIDRSGGGIRMIVRNADGSRPEMCGNGLRCVVGHLVLGDERAHGEIVVRTDAGERRCVVDRVSSDEIVAEVEMGRARFDGSIRARFEDREHTFASVNMGNPHAITFERYDRATLEAVAPIIERLPTGGTNVEFVTRDEDGFSALVWERGVGFTQACGTGACAVAAEACRLGLAPFDTWQRVRLPGGPLSIRVSPNTFETHMRGPARRVFVGNASLST